jgi:hypothetical protein
MSKDKTAYVSREGHRLQRVEWQRLRADNAYRTVRAFENDTIGVTAEWVGIGQNPQTVPPQHWKLYRLTVENIVRADAEGNPLPVPRRTVDPSLTRDFRTEQEAIDAYEDALVRFGGCEWLPAPDGATDPLFVEHGNKLQVGESKIDVRELADDVADLAGSW